MSITLIRILLVCCIPIGIFILVKGIKLIRGGFNGQILQEMSYQQGMTEFTIQHSGYFSIWQRSPLLTRTPIDQFKPIIEDTKTQQQIDVNPAYLGARTNGFSEGRMEVFTFSAPAGKYLLKLVEGNNLSAIQSAIASIIPLGSIDLSKHFLQIRKSQSSLLTLAAIPVILLGAFGIIGGFVFALLADQLFK